MESDKPLSRQRRYQLRKIESGLCSKCGTRPLNPMSKIHCTYCATKQRTRMRKITGCKRGTFKIAYQSDLEAA